MLLTLWSFDAFLYLKFVPHCATIFSAKSTCILPLSFSVLESPDLCHNHNCQNGGTCVPMPAIPLFAPVNRYGCDCTSDYEGALCEIGKINLFISEVITAEIFHQHIFLTDL